MCTYHKHKIHTTQHQYTSHTVQHKWDTIDYNWMLDHHCETPLTAWPSLWDTTDCLTVTLRHHWLLHHHSDTLDHWLSLWDITDCLTVTLRHHWLLDRHSETPLTAWPSLWDTIDHWPSLWDTTDCLTVTLNTINCLHCCLLELILSSKSQVVYASSCPYVN